jgi:hypothetical protein
MHERGFIDEFLTSGKLAIDVSWKLSDWTGGNWAQVENLYVNSNNTGFAERGRATTDTHQSPPWNGSWDNVNFGDDTRTLTWDMTDLIDGNLGNGEITVVPSANGGGYLQLILATNYDPAFDPNTAAFYFDNARLLPRVISSEWTGAAPDSDGDASNGNAATNNWFASMNWTQGVPGVADSVATFGTNGGAITAAQNIFTDNPVSLGTLNFDLGAGYTLSGAGTLTMDVSTGQAGINVFAGNHSIQIPVALADDTTITVAPANSTLTIANLMATTSAITKAGAGNVAVNNVQAGALTVNAGTVTVTANGSSAGTSRVGALSINNASAALDLNDNDLIVTSGTYAAVAGAVASARNGGAWNQGGLTSSAARTQTNHATTLGVLKGSEYTSVGGSSFDGFTVAPGDVLVKYTWYGDTDFNGKVNFDDYVRTDNGFNGHLSGWINGDFDLNGQVNFDDYVLIDLAFNTQSGTLGRALSFLDGSDRSSNGMSDAALQRVHDHFSEFGNDYANHLLAAVPEPASIVFAGVVASAAVLRRRRRDK